MKRIWSIVAAACLLFAASAGGGQANDGPAAVDLVRQLYAAHARNFAGDGPSVIDGGADSQRFFDPRVAALLRERSLGFDPLYDGQDAEISDLSIGLDPERGELRGTIFVRVEFRNFGAPVRLVYLLRRTVEGRWRIIDIEAREWRLSALLTEGD